MHLGGPHAGLGWARSEVPGTAFVRQHLLAEVPWHAADECSAWRRPPAIPGMSIIRIHPVNAAGGESGEGTTANAESLAGAPLRDPQWYHRPGTLRLPAPPPLSVYVHLPWCLKKCPYCDFNSHEFHTAGATPKDLPEQRYLDAVRADLERSLPLVWGRTVHTIFIGGGTPSLFSPDGIARLLSDLRMLLPLAADCEITMEANPGTFEKERFRAFAQAGVNRLSIGVQTFNDAQLRALGRVHDGAQALAAAEEAARSFETFNLDLMYALPGQTLADLDADLAQAFALGAPHLSLYHLTMEPNTVFAKRPPAGLPDDDTAYDMLDRVTDRTGGAGFERYEVSAYAKSGHRCRHNVNYWQFGDYLGLASPPPRQAFVRAPRDAPGALARAGHVHGPRAGRAGRVQRDRRGARGAAVRVHAQRAAPARRLRLVAVHRALRPAAVGDRDGPAGGRITRAARSQRPARRGTGAAHRARVRLPQRSAGTVPVASPASRRPSTVATTRLQCSPPNS
jgi:putative oxygen-independent coproporphyrinogen III oxidase